MMQLGSTSDNLIQHFLSPQDLKFLYANAISPELEDNNDKADIIIKYFEGSAFQELGPGTNRLALMRNNLVFLFALDRRGIIDNLQEFKRSEEKPEILALSYETNGTVLIQEYLTSMELDVFNNNKSVILDILAELSEDYIFEDLGFTTKNYMNWGFDDQNNVKVLDYGYLWPRVGQERALTCPRCIQEFGPQRLRWNSDYTGFVCSHRKCVSKYSTTDIRRRMNDKILNWENDSLSTMYLNAIGQYDFKDTTGV